MLYECWRQTCLRHENETALWDLSSGRQWTFQELGRLSESGKDTGDRIIYPQGQGAEFILTLLKAWRHRVVAFPLESNQSPPAVSVPPAECCHLKITSATTGAPRLIAFKPEQLAADADNIVVAMGLRPDWPNLGAISLAHSYGFSNLVLPLLLHGVPLILAPSPLPEVVRRILTKYPRVTLPGVPALWRAWCEAGTLQPSIRLAISAGAPLPPSLEKTIFQKHGLKIHNFYGSSECGGIAYDGTEAPRISDACVGAVVKNVDVEVGPDGCLVVRGQAVAETYWPQPDESLGTGCFRTCDLAEIQNGQVFLRGRLGDQINVAGRKLSPAAIEQALLRHPDVVDCLVFGVPSADVERTEVIVACIEMRVRRDSETLRQFLLDSLPGWQIPREWWFVDALKRNERGKMPRAEWRREYLQRRTAKPQEV